MSLGFGVVRVCDPQKAAGPMPCARCDGRICRFRPGAGSIRRAGGAVVNYSDPCRCQFQANAGRLIRRNRRTPRDFACLYGGLGRGAGPVVGGRRAATGIGRFAVTAGAVVERFAVPELLACVSAERKTADKPQVGCHQCAR